VIGGYIPNGDALDSILVGYYKGRDLMYAGSVHAGIPSEFRPVLVAVFRKVADNAMSVCQSAGAH
jgi:hypothetical protein